MSDQILQAFDDKFRVQELMVLATDHWRWSVRPVQPTLGSGVLSMRRYASSFSDATAEEMADLHVVTNAIERVIREAFNYDKINYLMLMMVDPHVHFHVIPRYEANRTFGGQDWSDSGWPGVPQLPAPASEQTLLHSLRDEFVGRV